MLNCILNIMLPCYPRSCRIEQYKNYARSFKSWNEDFKINNTDQFRRELLEEEKVKPRFSSRTFRKGDSETLVQFQGF